ncbi:hypothetical protein [uncultured Desulfuromonas sp.]|uniref:hypothetical protein n=1 Tax=uncultured Desulfuromonas sp. TaxID=181013 RepID=UPI002AAB96F3|nr:hypothetical protein [uncultured Desulfuromonas sp.]
MKRVVTALALMLAMAAPALAVEFEFHGDLKTEIRINSNQSAFTGQKEFAAKLYAKDDAPGKISDDDVNDSFMSFKYRLWTEVASDDGAVKGVYAIEIGGTHFGDADKGGSFSGDGKTVETRWAYTDFALADGRMKVGLQPVKVNQFFWGETATGVDYKVGNFEAAWFRGYEMGDTDSNAEDLDAFYLRYNIKPAEDVKIGLFGVWQTSDASGDLDSLDGQTWKVKKLAGYDLDLYTLGIDGGMKSGAFFANWDLMYQTGDFMVDVDFGGYFAHIDLGAKLGNGKLTYTFWYASGDDDREDGDLDAFIATDVDIKADYSSVVLFQGLNSDQYFSADPYIQDKGFMINRVAYDAKVSDRLKVGAAAMYMMTAEDMEYTDGTYDYADDSIGFEIDVYAKYKMYKSLELALAAGYLMTDDALDFYEDDHDGSADEDIYVITSRIRYKF